MNTTIKITVKLDNLDQAPLTFRGREAWCLGQLIAAGKKGCTPIEQPAPRWSQYVMMLRRAGISIETLEESHGGSFKVTHGRYVLRSPLHVIEEIRAAA